MSGKAPRIREVPAVTRAIAILRLLSKSKTPLSLKEIANSLNLIPSTALHILRALLAEQFVKLEPQTKRYGLGVGILPFAKAVLEHSDFPGLVRPKLDEISTRHAVTAIATEVPDLKKMIVVALASAPGPVRLHVDIGSRFPALIHAVGRCVAAFSDAPWQEIEQQFCKLKWENGPDYDTWCKEVENVRRQGYSIDSRNYFDGMTLVAVPVLNHQGKVSHTIAAVGISSQLNRTRAKALALDMRAAAEELSDQMVTGV